MSKAVANQLHLIGLEETRRQAELFSPTKSVLSRRLNRIDATHAAMGNQGRPGPQRLPLPGSSVIPAKPRG